MSKVAIVHDYFVQTGGAERVAEALYSIYPEATVFATVALARSYAIAARGGRGPHYVDAAASAHEPILPPLLPSLSVGGRVAGLKRLRTHTQQLDLDMRKV